MKSKGDSKMTKPILVLGVAITLGACATNPVERELTLDGPRTASFATDKAACKRLAVNYDDGSSRGDAILGAALGGLVGVAEEENIEGAIVGAAIGGTIGKLEGEAVLDKERRNVLIRCMQGRGHKVVG
jgi:hypothetical protein